jgi:hypothetical protein
MCETEVTTQLMLLSIRCTCQYNILKMALNISLLMEGSYLKRKASVEYILLDDILIVALTTMIQRGIAITFSFSG